MKRYIVFGWSSGYDNPDVAGQYVGQFDSIDDIIKSRWETGKWPTWLPTSVEIFDISGDELIRVASASNTKWTIEERIVNALS